MALAALVSRTNQYQLKSGALNVGGKIYVYKDETDDLADVYDEDGRILAQPLVTDSNGRTAGPMVDSDGVYRLEVQDAYGALIYPVRHMVPAGGSGGVDVRTVITSDDGSIIVTPTDHGYDISLPKASVVQATSSELNAAGPFSIYEIRKQQGTDIWLDQTTNKLMCNKGWYHCDVSVVMQNSTARNEMLVVGFSDTLDQWHGDYNLDLSYTNQRCESFSFDVYVGRDGTELSIIETQALPSGVKMFLHTFDIHTIFGGSLGGIQSITSTDGSITVTETQDGVDLALTNPPSSVLTVRHEANKDGTYDTLGTFSATGGNTTITVPKEAYSFQIGNRSCFYNDVLMAYLTDKPVFAYEVYSWYDQGHQKQDLYQYMAQKQYWGDNNFYDGTANIQFIRIDVDANKIVMQKCLPETPSSITGYARWEKTEVPLDEGAGTYYVEYGTTTYADALAAYQDGKTLVLRKVHQSLQQDEMDDLYPCIGWYESGSFAFARNSGNIQENVSLTPSATYTERSTVLATCDNVMKTASAEIAPEYYALCLEHVASNEWPIPVGTVVTYLDNTSSDELQYVYRSKVAIEHNDYYNSDPLAAPQKWDKVHISDIMSQIFYAEMFQTPYDDIKAAYDRGDVVVGRMSTGDIYPLYYCSTTQDIFEFACLHGYTWLMFTCWKGQFPSSNDWNPQPGIVNMAQQVNITNMGDYSNQQTYAVGDLVYNGGNIFRCTTAIDAPENWNNAHWTQTSINQELARFATVARSGDYNDLINTPTIPTDKVFHAVYGSTTFAEITDAVTAGKLVYLTGVTGSSDTVYTLTTYTSPRPELAIFHAVNGNTVYKAQIESGTWSTGSTTLATSADLANYQEKLTAGANITIDANNVISATAAPQEQADWAQTDSTAVDYIKNKPTIPVVPDLKPLVAGSNITITENANDVTISAAGGTQQQADWAQTVTTAVDYIKNKPDLSVYATTADLSTGLAAKQDVINDLSTIRSGAAAGATAVQPADLATVATTGDYADLTNKPTIPAAQVNSDWNASSGVAEILNKPHIPVVGTITL